MADNTIDIRIDIEGNAKKQLNVLGSSVKKFEKSSTRSLGVVGAAFASFAGNLAAAGVGSAFRLAARGVTEFAGVLKRGITLAQVQEDAVNNLNAALKRSGSFSQAASQDMQDFASSLQQTTTTGDETILQMLALAKAFGATNEVAKKTTQAALELSAAAGISLEEATRRIGRSFSGSVDDVSKFATGIKDLTKEELAAGRAADLLIESLGGAAAAQVNTFSGAVAQLSNTYGDTLESVGELVTKNEFFIDAIKIAQDFLLQLQGTIKGNEDAIKELLQNGFIKFVEFIGSSVIPFLEKTERAFLSTVSAAAQLRGSLNVIPAALGDKTSLKILEQTAQTVANVDARVRELNSSSSVYKLAAEKVKLFEDALRKIPDAQKEINEEAEKQREPAAAKKDDDATIKKIEDAKKRIAALRVLDEEANAGEIERLLMHQQVLIDSLEEGSTKKLEQQAAFITATQKLNTDRAAAEIAALGLVAEQTFENDQALTFALLEESERRELALSDLDAAANASEIEQEREHQQALINELEKGSTEQLSKQASFNKKTAEKCEELARKEISCEQKKAEAKLSILGKTFSGLASLTQSGNRELFEIGKAAAIAEAIVNGIISVTQAIRTPPGPPITIPLGIAAGVAAAVQVSKIASTQFGAQKGLTEVPKGFPNDSFPAALTSGERVVSAEQNKDLKQFLQSSDGLNGRIEQLIQRPIVVQVDGATILDVVQEQVDSGRTLNI